MIRFNRALCKALALMMTIPWVSIILSVTVSSNAYAELNLANAPQIFDARKSLPLEPDEEAVHDFLINAGPEAGLKKGMFVSVVRQVPVHNPIVNKQQATLSVMVGRVHIIHVERGISVGRMDSELTDDDRPTLEFEGIMIGDRIDMDSATMEAPKVSPAKARSKSARVEVKVEVTPESPPPPTVASAAPAVTTPPEAPKVVPTAAIAPTPPASGGAEKASPSPKQPDMVRVPVPAVSNVAGAPTRR
jgi:hypothetical protein